MKQTTDQTLLQAINLHKESKLKEAENLYREILNENQKHSHANHNLGVLLFSLNNIEDSLQLFKTALEVDPINEQFLVSYAKALIKDKKIKETEVIYKKLVELKPDHNKFHYNLAIIQQKLNNLEEAIASFKNAIKLKPDYAEAYINLGNLLHGISRSEEAIEIYKKATIYIPSYHQSFNNLGVAQAALNRLDEAEVNFKKAIEIKSDFFEAYYNLGTMQQYKKNNLDEAEKSYNKTLTLNPTFEKALICRGLILFNRGKFELALKDFDNCDTAESQSSALVSLYALGRIDEIYQRIESQSELDENLGVAAFSTFISYKEKKNTAHKFCNNPMDFIKSSNLSSHLKDSNLFINELIEELQNLKTVWEPAGKPVFKAFQSETNFNLFENPSEKINNLKSIIMDEIDLYYKKFRNENCSFIQKWPSGKNINGWHVIYKKQGFQDSHIHAGGWLSGVIYLKVVPPLKKNEGAIEFGLNSEFYSDPNSPKIIHQPKAGDIVLFPSSLHHKTIPFTTDTDRIIISFDLLPDIK